MQQGVSTLKKMSAEIVYLQETHLHLKDHGRLSRKGYSWCTTLLVRNGVQFVENEVILDKNGRLVIIKGKLFGIPVVLANVCAPNWDDVTFFELFFSHLPALESQKLILGGDFNCVLCPGLDRSKPTIRAMSKAAQAVLSFIQAYGVTDPWRQLNPLSKAFSFPIIAQFV